MWRTWTFDSHKPQSTVEWSSHMCREVKLHLFSLQRFTSNTWWWIHTQRHTKTHKDTAVSMWQVRRRSLQDSVIVSPSSNLLLDLGSRPPGQRQRRILRILPRGRREVESREVVVNLTVKAKTKSISGKFPVGRARGSEAAMPEGLGRKKTQQKVTCQSCEDCDLSRCNTFWSDYRTLSGKCVRKTHLWKRFFWQESTEMRGRNKLFSWKQETFDCERLPVTFQWNVFPQIHINGGYSAPQTPTKKDLGPEEEEENDREIFF